MLACTVATVDHLAHARVLAASLSATNPGARLAVLIADDRQGRAGDGEPFDVLRPSDLGVDDAELGRRGLIYTGSELACSFKAPLLRHLVDQSDEPVAFLDADCLVYGDMAPLPEAAVGSGFALTAHSLVPLPPGQEAVEALFQQNGAFNTGVVAATARGRPVLDWWAARTARHGLHDIAHGLVADQSWIGLVPTLFDYTLVRDRGINVMGWNLVDRDVEWDGDRPTVEGGPVRCFHFAGFFDPHRPDAFGPAPDRRDPWPPTALRPGATRICHDYAGRLLAAGYDELQDVSYAYAQLPDGTRIGPVMRELYRETLLRAERDGGEPPPNPFVDSTVDAFLSWLASPGTSGAPRYLERVRARRHDLVQAFPAVPGPDAAPLLKWGREAGARDEIDLDWLR